MYAIVVPRLRDLPDDPLGVLNLLSSHELAPVDIRIDPHHAPELLTSPAERG